MTPDRAFKPRHPPCHHSRPWRASSAAISYPDRTGLHHDPTAGGAQTSPHLALTIGTPGPNLMRDGTFDSPLSALPVQTALQLQSGQVYRLSFRARASAPTALHVALAGVTTEVSLTTGWRQYVAYFRVPEDATDTQLNLGLVDGTGKVLLDGIALVGASQ